MGKVFTWEVNDSTVEIKSNDQRLIVQVITDEIIRFLIPKWKADYKSVAIEGDVTVPTDFDVDETEEGIEIKIPVESVFIIFTPGFVFGQGGAGFF